MPSRLCFLVCSNIIFEAFVNICQIWQHTPLAMFLLPSSLPHMHPSPDPPSIHPGDGIDSSRPFRLHAKLITCTNNNWAEVLIVAKGQTDEPQGCMFLYVPALGRRTARTSRTTHTRVEWSHMVRVCAFWQVKSFAIACHLRTGPQPEDTPDHGVDHRSRLSPKLK